MNKKTGSKRKAPEQQAMLPGEIRYRPPTGTEGDRLLNRVRMKPMASVTEYRPPKQPTIPAD